MAGSERAFAHPPADSSRSKSALAFEGENFGVFTSPLSLTLPIFPENYSETHASASVAVLASFAQSNHPLPQLVANYGALTTPFRPGDYFNAAGGNADTLRVRLSAQCHW
jgi:hypothetical protein